MTLTSVPQNRTSGYTCHRESVDQIQTYCDSTFLIQEQAHAQDWTDGEKHLPYEVEE